MGQIKCKMTPPNLSMCHCLSLAVLLPLCCDVTPSLSLASSVCVCLSAVPGASPTGLSSFWKKRKVSCPGRKCGELVWRTDRCGPSLTLTGRKGPSATRPGACPSTAGQSLCAYHPKAKDREVNGRRTGLNVTRTGHVVGHHRKFWGDWTLIISPVGYWLQRHHNHLSPVVDHLVVLNSSQKWSCLWVLPLSSK